ncbi:BatD family protein [Lysobacter brunescens]|uniref:BatD family protein n=1 Tax=Lysobacter brunescens TaxID=262323 RepID=A0ABW2YGJ7_9GAMM
MRRACPQRVGRLAGIALLLCLALAWTTAAQAQVRAWLEPDRIALDETTELSIEIDGISAHGLPDLSLLSQDFRVLDQGVAQQVDLSNGQLNLRIIMRMRLQPRREGVLQVPILQIGNGTTPPLRLVVGPPKTPVPKAVAPDDPALAAQPLFLESKLDTPSPYVQQTVGYTVRLYYEAGSLIDGRLDQDAPDGASLQQLGEDMQHTLRVGDRFYKVLERRYLLIPERPGTLTVPPARFQGRSLGVFGDPFDTARQEVRARGRPQTLQVKPIPPAAPQPWLPLRALSLRYLETPRSLRAGESATVTVELHADGATTSQLPALELKTGEGARVFPDQARRNDRFLEGRPLGTITRRFAVLSSRAGTLRVSAPRITWWDAQAGVARVASLPDIVLDVAPGKVTTAAGSTESAQARNPRASDWPRWLPRGAWLVATVVLVLLWIGTVWWAWRLLMRHRAQQDAAAGRPSAMPGDTHGATLQAQASIPASAPSTPDWSRALAEGDPALLLRALCALASPAAADADALRERLADPAQREAVAGLQRACWGDGDRAAAVATARTAFASGPRWRAASAARPGDAALPPLYPD